jgi:hypothetical protein
VRIAIKPVTNSPSTPEATPAKSSGSSFLDILSQGTQDAVQSAKAAGSQTQSDTDSSQQPAAGEQKSPEAASPSQDNEDASAPAANTHVQTAASNPSSSSQQNAQPIASTTQIGAPLSGATQHGSAQGNISQSVANLLLLANLTVQSKDTSADKQAVLTTATTPTQTTAKSTGTTKSAPAKQDAAPADSTASLQQALAALQQMLTVPAAIPQVVAGTAQVSSKPDQPGLPATAAAQVTAADATSADAASANAKTTNATGANATNTSSTNTTAASATGQQDVSQAGKAQTQAAPQPQQAASAITDAAALQFQNDLAGLTAAAAQLTAPESLPPANHAANALDTKQTLTTSTKSSTAAGTLFSGATVQIDNSASQAGSAKVIPFKMPPSNSATNLTSASSTTVNTSTNATTATAATKNNAQDSSNGSASRDSQSSGDATVSAQAANTVVRPTDATAAQAMALATATPHPVAAQSGSSATTATDSAPSHASEAHNLPSEPTNTSLPAGSSAINTARVIQTMNETEMRVGMHSSEFGDISIRTMVTQQQMQAQISVDHSELVSALSAHIPSVQAKLGADYGLHASIEVSQGGASFSSNQGQSSQRDYKPSTSSSQFDGTVSAVAETVPAITRSAAAPAIESARLDIRA